MSKICYVPKKFVRSSMHIIRTADAILQEYGKQGLILTIRQLYYQFVARDILPNKQKSYDRLVAIIGDARLAGLIDWDSIEDRTRNLQLLIHFQGPEDALKKLGQWYHLDMWEKQTYRPEVWIEKDALVGVIEAVCQENDVPFFSCRGYTSLSEMWRSAMRMKRWIRNGQTPYIIHFGDHDPSGIDMSRDIFDRISKTFMSGCAFERVALNMDQIEQYKPPPNPAKVTDSRYEAYVAKYGDESWELDALEPSKFRELIENQLGQIRNNLQWNEDVTRKQLVKTQLEHIATDWQGVSTYPKVIAKLTKQLDNAIGHTVKRISKKPKRGK